MRVCLMIEGQEGVAWEEWPALAGAAEQAGLDGLFRSDHYTSFHGPAGPALDAWATLAALAVSTSRIRLGTLVSASTFRHPSELARVVATVDHVSGGRVDVGVGAGWFEVEHRQNGFPFPPTPERFDRFCEYVEVLVQSWTGEAFDHDGRYFALDGQRALPPPLQRPHPPLVLGGQGKARSVALAARYAHEYNVIFVPVDEAARLRQRLDEACESAGRDPGDLRLSLMTLVALGIDRSDADARLGRALRHFRGPAERCHSGTVEEMADLLGRYEAAGVSRVFLQHPDRADFEAIELIGQLAAAVA